MSRRTTEAYTSALKYVHEKLISLKGDGFIIDFEKAMRTALQKVVPDINLMGCWFHFCQSLRRKMASLKNLHEMIRKGPKSIHAKDIFRRFQCLALLPSDKIEPAFLKLSQEALKLSEHFAEFIDYFHQEWIQRVKPRFFSVFMRHTRTTSAAESFNAKLNRAFKTHGNFYHFIEQLQIEECASTDQLEKYMNGHEQKDKQKPFYKKRAKKIKHYSNLLKNDEINPDMFLKIMANPKNSILYSESDISLHNTEVELSVGAELVEGTPSLEAENSSTLYNSEDELDADVEISFAGESDDLLEVSFNVMSKRGRDHVIGSENFKVQ